MVKPCAAKFLHYKTDPALYAVKKIEQNNLRLTCGSEGLLSSWVHVPPPATVPAEDTTDPLADFDRSLDTDISVVVLCCPISSPSKGDFGYWAVEVKSAECRRMPLQASSQTKASTSSGGESSTGKDFLLCLVRTFKGEPEKAASRSSSSYKGFPATLDCSAVLRLLGGEDAGDLALELAKPMSSEMGTRSLICTLSSLHWCLDKTYACVQRSH